ncbi:hypothetical protein EVAR_94400_1 [Eumeta japonica]|uniref:Uncharacterized protein n=1 Tax=Eumeta variegata TaxID=151549 RepID=A0A4C1TQ20_EUMVA|nr:hypothetical protein EVAR_94400_1 [Eumeta japonica]
MTFIKRSKEIPTLKIKKLEKKSRSRLERWWRNEEYVVAAARRHSRATNALPASWVGMSNHNRRFDVEWADGEVGGDGGRLRSDRGGPGH